MPGACGGRANSGARDRCANSKALHRVQPCVLEPWTYNPTALAAMDAGSAVPGMTIKIPSTILVFCHQLLRLRS